MNSYKPGTYPFNSRSVTRYETNMWKKYENVLFSDKETLTTTNATPKTDKQYVCIAISDNNVITKSCIEKF